MTRTLRTDFAAVNAKGVTVRTFDDERRAKTWVRENALLHDGLTLERVKIVAERIYRPRVANRARDFAIPAMPAGVGA